LNARVRLTTNGVTQLGEVRSGGSYLSQNDLRLHFGLGAAKNIDTLEVLWPGGATQVFHAVAGDRFYKLKQGGELNPITFAARK
jgi:enediyne biosynthesis protein E4